MTLEGSTELTNNGEIALGGEEGYVLKTMGEARIVNRGRFDLGVETDLAAPIENQGEFYYTPWLYGDEGFTRITGREPKPKAE